MAKVSQIFKLALGTYISCTITENSVNAVKLSRSNFVDLNPVGFNYAHCRNTPANRRDEHPKSARALTLQNEEAIPRAAVTPTVPRRRPRWLTNIFARPYRPDPMTDLPDDVLRSFFAPMFSDTDLFAMSRVSRRFKSAFEREERLVELLKEKKDAYRDIEREKRRFAMLVAYWKKHPIKVTMYQYLRTVKANPRMRHYIKPTIYRSFALEFQKYYYGYSNEHPFWLVYQHEDWPGQRIHIEPNDNVKQLIY